MSKTTSSKRLPKFPDEETPPHWVWPPYVGSNILNEVAKHVLKPRLQPDGTWIINAKNQWRCFSKSHWLYTSTELAYKALRANMRMHLQCSPILSEQRCVAIASNGKNDWRLWQIAHLEPTLAESLTKALAEKQPDKLALETFRCTTHFLDVLQQCVRYPPLLNLTLENLGTDTKQLVYLGIVENDGTSNQIQFITKDVLENAIKQAFTTPIAKALANIDVSLVVNEFEAIDGVEQQYILKILKEMFLA